MQRAGIQRNDSDVVRGLTMFTTQRFQNYGILADAVGDYKAQKARYAADQSAENKAGQAGPGACAVESSGADGCVCSNENHFGFSSAAMGQRAGRKW